ncbi:MAG: helix-turn-helix domain-containing protein, partial [Planctomycetes bacterium]|nr:helix-turn-helix domain-containing protein [Planctomycetota bacterium]
MTKQAGNQQLLGPRVVVVVYNGLCTFEFGIAVEIFGLSRPELGNDWYRFQVCSAEGPEVPVVGGVHVRVEAGLEALEQADIVVVPGWRDPRQRPPGELTAAIIGAHERGARIVGICGGVFVLAATGLLSNKRATTHWRFLDDFIARNPDIRVDRAPLYCDDDRILTSAGSAAGIDLCLHIVRSDYGTEIANIVARRLVTAPLRGGDQPQRRSEDLVPACKDQQLADFLLHLKADLATQYTSVAAARELSMSQRTFHRKFHALTGESYGQWVSKQRLERAKNLLRETDLSIEQITEACGFASSGSLRRLFREFTDGSPKE